MDKIFQPRLEITNNNVSKFVWQDWGQFKDKNRAVRVAKDLVTNIKRGRYNHLIADIEKTNGYYLNAAVEVLDADSFELLCIEEVA